MGHLLVGWPLKGTMIVEYCYKDAVIYKNQDTNFVPQMREFVWLCEDTYTVEAILNFPETERVEITLKKAPIQR